MTTPRFELTGSRWCVADEPDPSCSVEDIWERKGTNKRAVAIAFPMTFIHVAKPSDAKEHIRLRNEHSRTCRELRKEATKIATEMLAQLVSATTGLFGGEATFYEDCDPEYPADRFHVLAVATTLDPEGILRAEREWIASVRKISPYWDSLRLSIRPT